jgi:hypothetical protein
LLKATTGSCLNTLKRDNNYLCVPIYCNDSFGYGRGRYFKLDEEFFGIEGEGAYRDLILRITWSDLIRDGNFRTKRDLEENLGLILNDEKFIGLKNAYRSAYGRFHKIGGKVTTISEFLNGFKKGAKYFRKVISETKFTTIKSVQQWKTFSRLIDCQETSEKQIVTLLTNWNSYFLNTHIRTFLFKFYNNILGLNSRVTHFNPDVNGGCTFCSIKGPYPVPSETIVHLFFECCHVNHVIESVTNKYLQNVELTKQNYFITEMGEFECVNKPLNIFFDVLRYLIWQAKLEKTVPVTQKIFS